MKKMILTSILSAALLMHGCNDKILDPLSSTPDYVLIDGDTIKTRDDKDKFKLSRNSHLFVTGDTTVLYKDWKLTKKSLDSKTTEKLKAGIEDPDLKGKPLRMVVVGGGISAGVRNDTYNNEYLSTSFPNLVAMQMGIDFRQPYFDAADYNGFTTRIKTNENITGGPLPKFKNATNNLAIESIDNKGNVKLKPLKENRVDNYSLKTFEGFREGNRPGLDESDVEPSLRRISKDKINTSYRDLVLQEKFDFLIEATALTTYNYYGGGARDMAFPNGFEGYVDTRNSYFNQYPRFSERINFLLEIKKRKGMKGVLFTMAGNIHCQPYNEFIDVIKVRKQLEIYQKPYLMSRDIKNIIPTYELDSLLGIRVNMNLKPFIKDNRQILGSQFACINRSEQTDYTKETYSLAKALNFAVVDLEKIYYQILTGTYNSPDGVKVNVVDFYAEDGMYPSAFGQTVIANETIKSINGQYGLSIPYVNSRDFLKK